ncbi:MAG: porin [Myxococcaceae bacterium]|nr:MAG: porin [Myxococcaceae bacterium]
MRNPSSLVLAGLIAVSFPGAALAQSPEPERAPRVRAALGHGVTVTSADGAFEFNLRARAQIRFTLTGEEGGGDPATEFSIRRMRLVLQGHALSNELQYYIQLGFSNRDTESDLRLPLRDAYVTWTRLRDLQVRAGQMKVPFDRQRVISSSAQQFVDRSIVTGELNLDRDVGVQLYSRDLFGLGRRLGYQLGVFGGDGRNRLSSESGLLWVARLEFTPMGAFDDYVESDLERHDSPRLSVGVGVAYNQNTRRSRSTFETSYDRGRFDYLHGEADLSFKWRGLSVLGAALLRRANAAAYQSTNAGGAPTIEYSRSSFGWFAQAGYLFTRHFELVARYGDLRPTVLDQATVDPSQRRRHELGGGLNWYFQGHALKLQSDYFYYYGDNLSDRGEHQARLQMQLFF